MAATSGNTHITDGETYSQAQCDEYLGYINDLKLDHDWMTGVNKTYMLKNYDYDGTTFTKTTDDIEWTGAGASAFYPAWRTDNPDVTAVVQGNQATYAYEQWDYYTNSRTEHDADAVEIGKDLDIMKATHVEMLATVD